MPNLRDSKPLVAPIAIRGIITLSMLISKIKSFVTSKKTLLVLVLSAFGAVQIVSLAGAQSVTRAYGSDQLLQRGMIVGLTKASSSKVEPIDETRLATILGVVVNPNDSPITISSDNQHVFVTTSGRYDVLVSDQEGPIRANDYITLSALSGVGMKATDRQSNIVGRTAGTFDGKTNVLSTTPLSAANGKKQTVHIGRIQVDITIARNPLVKTGSGAPALLDQTSRAIVGRVVSATRLYLATFIFIVGTVTAGSILYAGIRGSIIAIGRNPLSRRSIFRSMIGVAFTSIIVFLVAVIGVYLLLKL